MEQSALPPVSLEELDKLATRASTVIDRLRDRLYAPGTQKTLDLRFNVKRAADMVGRSDQVDPRCRSGWPPSHAGKRP